MTTPPFTKCPACGAVAMHLRPDGGADCASCGADKAAPAAPNLEHLLTYFADPLKGLFKMADAMTAPLSITDRLRIEVASPINTYTYDLARDALDAIEAMARTMEKHLLFADVLCKGMEIVPEETTVTLRRHADASDDGDECVKLTWSDVIEESRAACAEFAGKGRG